MSFKSSPNGHWRSVAEFLSDQCTWATVQLQNRSVHDETNWRSSRDYGAWMQRMRDYIEREKLSRLPHARRADNTADDSGAPAGSAEQELSLEPVLPQTAS